MRRSISVCSTTPSECEVTWIGLLDRPAGSDLHTQTAFKPESAQSLLARGVKRRLHGHQPDLTPTGPFVCSQKLKNGPAEPYPGHKGKQTGPGADSLDSLSHFCREGHAGSWGNSSRCEKQLHQTSWHTKLTIPASIPRPGQHWQHLEETDADVAVDVDCCGDSGSMSKISSRSSAGSSACVFNKSLHRLSTRNACGILPTVSEQDRPSSGSMPVSPVPVSQQKQEQSSSLPMAITPRMPKAGSELSEQQASTEMTFRLNHARQTVEFVQRQAASFGQLNKAKLGIWEALQHLDSLDEQRSIVATAAEEPHMSLFDHAIQTAELCRLAHPQQDWLHLVGLIHGLGKLMALPSFGAQPSWAVFAESFPVGCRFSSSIPCSQFFSVNPDRRRRLYSSTTGMYESGCGLSAVYMSWTACEYLYLMLVKKKTALPPVARFVLRHYNFLALMRPGNAYTELLSSADFAMMPWLRKFQALQQAPQQHIEGRLEGHDLRQYYNGLVAKFIPGGMLQF